MALLFFLSVIGIQVVEAMALVATLLYLVSWHGRIEQQHDGKIGSWKIIYHACRYSRNPLQVHVHTGRYQERHDTPTSIHVPSSEAHPWIVATTAAHQVVITTWSTWE